MVNEFGNGVNLRWKNGGLWKLKKMVIWNEEEEEDGLAVGRKREEKKKKNVFM